MAKHRLTTTAALLALAAFGALAPSASASSTLLSGYGGPGQGNQAILGSTLIGGGGSGSSGGASGGSSSGASSPQSTSIEATQAPAGTAGTTGSGSGKGAGNGARAGHQRRSHASPAPAAAPAPETIARVVDVRTVSAPALGLSGSDIAFIVLAVLVLALTAALTVVLSRGTGASRGGPGEIGSG